MTKKVMFFVFIVFMLLYVPINVYAVDTVKCEYKIYNTEKKFLTNVYVYFNPKNNSVSKITHKNKSGTKEVDFKSFDADFEGYSSKGSFQYLRAQKDLFGAWIDNYKATQKCPNIYLYEVNEGGFYDVIGVNYNASYNNYSFTTSKPEKKWISSDGKAWKDSNSSSDSEKNDSKIKSCEYNIGTKIGSQTTNNHLNINVKIDKISNSSKIYYNVTFKDSNSNFEKNFNSLQSNSWPHSFNLGKSSYSSNNTLVVSLDSSTLENIFANDTCLAKEKLYSYFNPDSADGNWEINITSNKKEADKSEETIYDGDSATPNNSGNGNGALENIELPTGDPMTCESLKNTDTYKIVKEVFKWIQIAAPIMLIIFGVIDFGKAVASGDNDALKKAQATFVKRVIVVAIIVLLPLIMELLFSLLDGALGNNVSTCEINK